MCSPPPAPLTCPPQGKGSVPKGKLSAVYPEGVLFITYSLLVTRSGLQGSAARKRTLPEGDMPPGGAAGPSSASGVGDDHTCYTFHTSHTTCDLTCTR